MLAGLRTHITFPSMSTIPRQKTGNAKNCPIHLAEFAQKKRQLM